MALEQKVKAISLSLLGITLLAPPGRTAPCWDCQMLEEPCTFACVESLVGGRECVLEDCQCYTLKLGCC